MISFFDLKHCSVMIYNEDRKKSELKLSVYTKLYLRKKDNYEASIPMNKNCIRLFI